ncbi:TolB family protein [Leeuwenhoekiella sp. W20_SRS_FM14]|uniref:TolB family protein n=1 Tax=Leeuwenhoekiella sp. W20_SRS_FM14 TaxID=3240270 RepID=UPI003F98D2C2
MNLTNHNSHHAYFKKLATLTLAVTLHSLLLLGQSKSKKGDLAYTILPNPSPEINHNAEADIAFETEELSLNTAAFEYASCIFQNELIVVSKRKIGSARSGITTILDQSDFKLIGFTKNDNNWSQPHILKDAFMGTDNHGGITFSKDENRVFFTKTSPERPNSYQIYTAERSSKFAKSWQNEKLIVLADSKYSIENPWLSADGKKLYFASNMPGGYGGYDIYAVTVFKNGIVGKPENLGAFINSEHDENYPTLNVNNTKLYFASNRKESYGGFDLFQCYVSSGNYSRAKNLGSSINSIFDEFGFITTSETTGYFSSNENALSKNPNIYSFSVKP